MNKKVTKTPKAEKRPAKPGKKPAKKSERRILPAKEDKVVASPGRQSAASEREESHLKRWLRENRITEVECLVPDMTGNARGKIIPAAKFSHDFGTRLPEGIFATTVTGEYIDEYDEIVSASDSDGTVVDEEGFTPEKLALLAEVKSDRRGRVSDYAARVKARFLAGTKPWSIPMDVALPCATQNELDAEDAATLIRTGVTCVAEGANMPCTADAVKAFESAGVLYAPGKASNAGGVATSGLEMSQNAIRLAWTADEVDQRLRQIMHGIHDACVEHGGRPDGRASYVDGANIAGFARVARAMRAQGVF